ncbi:HAD-like domain-containing protein [Suillus occidentalis]|nr:HAD-like domain-containing protein [Suillus occidentalis]
MSQESHITEPVIYHGKKFIVLSDWDGTITTQDSNDFVTDTYGMGLPDRVALNQSVRNGQDNFRDAFRKMLVSVVENGKVEGKVTHTFEFCKNAVANNIKVDDTFKAFYEFCGANDIPVVVVSSVLHKHLASLDGIQIISNEVKTYDDGSWEIQYRHPESGFGHDKSEGDRPIHEHATRSDHLSAARGATCLFVKYKPNGENELMEYCIINKIKHRLFQSFEEAQGVMKLIIFAETEEERQSIIAREWPEVA